MNKISFPFMGGFFVAESNDQSIIKKLESLKDCLLELKKDLPMRSQPIENFIFQCVQDVLNTPTISPSSSN